MNAGGSHDAPLDRTPCHPGPRDPVRVARIPCPAAGKESSQDRRVTIRLPSFITRLEAAIGALAGAEHFGLDGGSEPHGRIPLGVWEVPPPHGPRCRAGTSAR